MNLNYLLIRKNIRKMEYYSKKQNLFEDYVKMRLDETVFNPGRIDDLRTVIDDKYSNFLKNKYKNDEFIIYKVEKKYNYFEGSYIIYSIKNGCFYAKNEYGIYKNKKHEFGNPFKSNSAGEDIFSWNTVKFTGVEFSCTDSNDEIKATIYNSNEQNYNNIPLQLSENLITYINQSFDNTKQQTTKPKLQIKQSDYSLASDKSLEGKNSTLTVYKDSKKNKYVINFSNDKQWTASEDGNNIIVYKTWENGEKKANNGTFTLKNDKKLIFVTDKDNSFYVYNENDEANKITIAQFVANGLSLKAPNIVKNYGSQYASKTQLALYNLISSSNGEIPALVGKTDKEGRVGVDGYFGKTSQAAMNKILDVIQAYRNNKKTTAQQPQQQQVAQQQNNTATNTQANGLPGTGTNGEQQQLSESLLSWYKKQLISEARMLNEATSLEVIDGLAELQTRLKQMGFYTGSADGKFWRLTAEACQQAIHEYEMIKQGALDNKVEPIKIEPEEKLTPEEKKEVENEVATIVNNSNNDAENLYNITLKEIQETIKNNKNKKEKAKKLLLDLARKCPNLYNSLSIDQKWTLANAAGIQGPKRLARLGLQKPANQNKNTIVNPNPVMPNGQAVQEARLNRTIDRILREQFGM